MSQENSYVHALKYQSLNWLYDPLVRLGTREKTVKATLVEAVSNRSGKLLDLACGSGTLAVLIKQAHPHLAVHGVDGDREMLSRAERKAASAGVDIAFKYGLAEALPYADGSFDMVVSSLFFHHLTTEGKHSAFLEIRRILSPSGRLIIADWGRPQNLLMRAVFFPVRLLDGFGNTGDNVQGKLPTLVRAAGFSGADQIEDIATPLGTISIMSADV